MAGARLHRRRVLPARARLDADQLVRAGPDFVEIGGFELALEYDVAGCRVVHLPRARRERGEHVDYRHYRREQQLDLIRDVLCVFLARGHHGGDRFADKAHLTPSASTGWATGL